MIETLFGGLLGGVFRLVPEGLKWLDRKGECGHELATQDKALAFEKPRGAQHMEEIGTGADAAAAWNVGAIETLRAAVCTQGEKTGVRWANALSNSLRPVITYLVHGAVLRRQDGSLRGCHRRRRRLMRRHSPRMDRNRPSPVGGHTELLVPLFDRVRP